MMTHARCSTRNHQSHWPTPSIAGRSTGDPILADIDTGTTFPRVVTLWQTDALLGCP